MKIPMALIADEANLSREGKLNVIGAFDRIAASSFPMVHPKMVFVFRIEAGFADSGLSVPVRVRLVDEDGEVLFEAGGEIGAPDVAPGDLATTYQLFALVGTRFPRPGRYTFLITLGTSEAHTTPLAVVQAPWPGDPPSTDN